MSNLEELILVAEDCPVSKSQVPPLGARNKSIARIGYEILFERPYEFTEKKYFEELHEVRRGRTDLKIETYNIKRAALVKQFGWGIHRNSDGKLALIPMESAEYAKLKETIKTTKAYRISKA